MTVFRESLWKIAAVGVCFTMLAGGTANAQISGHVIGTDLSAINNARVELWDSYPDGSRLHTFSSGTDGSFFFTGLTESSYDVRIWKGGFTEDPGLYFPSVIFDVPQPYPGLLLAVLAVTPEITVCPTTFPCDFWDGSYNSTYLGYAVQPGDVIGVQDPDGVWCGMLTSPDDAVIGGYLVHVLGDCGGGVDEGAIDGDTLTFFINNKLAVPQPPGTFGIWENGGSIALPLGGVTDIEGVTVTAPPDQLISPGDLIDMQFTIKNTGNHADAYDLAAVSEHGWTISMPGGAASGSLNPGESATITVQVQVPPMIPADSTDDVYLFAVSQANAGVIGGDRGLLDARTTGIFEEEFAVPVGYSLAQNYPNPFNPSTSIAYALEAGGHTTITVYNLLGQATAVLLDEFVPAGNHVAIWDGKDQNGNPLPSGIYFYRIRSGDFNQTRKMVLMK